MQDANKFSYQLLDKTNPVFCSFVVWSCVLIVKTMLMSPLTAFHRFRTKTAASPEDLAILRAQTMVTGNEDVERVRRAHLNDMENILPYLMVGLFYVLTDPKPLVSTILFKTATIARLAHTVVYLLAIPQPARSLCFFVHFGISIYFAFMSFIYFV